MSKIVRGETAIAPFLVSARFASYWYL